MGMKGSPTAQVHFDGVRVSDARRIGEEGQGFDRSHCPRWTPAVSASPPAPSGSPRRHSTRRSAIRHRARSSSDVRIADFQGLRFMLADMATQIEAGPRPLSRALPDCGTPGARSPVQAAMAKLFCTDAAMRVTTDAVQVLGGYGYTVDFPVERYMREAKVLQIVEGTNQIQRMVIARQLLGPESGR